MISGSTWVLGLKVKVGARVSESIPVAYFLKNIGSGIY